MAAADGSGRARARRALRRRGHVGIHGHHRQSRFHGESGRRSRSARRCRRVSLRSRCAGARRMAAHPDRDERIDARRRVRVNAAGLAAPGLARRLAPQYPSAGMPKAYYAKGQYYTLTRSLAVSPARLSGGGGGRAWRARHAGSRRPGALRSRRRLDRRSRLSRSMSAIANASSRRSVATTRTSTSVGCTRVTRESGRKSPPPAKPAADFLVPGPRDHGIDGSDPSVRHRVTGSDSIARAGGSRLARGRSTSLMASGRCASVRSSIRLRDSAVRRR